MPKIKKPFGKKEIGVFSKYRTQHTTAASNIYRWEHLEKFSDDKCFLVPLTSRQIAFITQSIEPGTWETRWKKGDDINVPDPNPATRVQWVKELEACLYMGCNIQDLIDAINSISSSDKLIFELSQINYNLDRIRDNLDSITPDGGAAEFSLATILAALGPNFTASTEYLKNINTALNSNAVDIPDEATDFVETGKSPALGNVYANNRLVGVIATRSAQNTIDLTLSVNVLDNLVNIVKKTEFLVEVKNSLGVSTGIIVFDVANGGTSDYSCTLREPDFIVGEAGVTGTVTAMDYFLNIVSDTY